MNELTFNSLEEFNKMFDSNPEPLKFDESLYDTDLSLLFSSV